MSEPGLRFQNFDLHIHMGDKPGKLQITVTDDTGNVLAAHKTQLYADPLVLSKLEDSVGAASPKMAAIVRDFGREIYNAVFGGEVLGYFRSLGKIDKDVRVRLLFKPEEPELLRIPWEFIYDGENFLAAYPRLTLTRVLEGIPVATREPITGKIKILAVVSSPLDLKDHQRLQSEQEQTLILNALDRAIAANKVEIEFLDEASVRNIQAKLDEEEFHILHYTGHGVYAEREDRGYLLLEDDSGRSRNVDSETVANLLAGYPALRLVVLSGCQTAKTSGRQALRDLATPLLRKQIPAVVAMQYSVADDSAIALAQKLYTEIADNVPVDLALTRARKELLLNRRAGEVDFATPVLYAADASCLAVKEEAAKAPGAGFGQGRPIAYNPNVDLRIQQLGQGFIGRRRELRRIKEDFLTRNMRVVVLHGIGGIGKTVTAAKVAERLLENFDGVYAFECSEGLSAELVLLKLHEFLKRNNIDVLDQVVTAPVPIDAKINALAQVLAQVKLLVIFDNFEPLLAEEKDRREIADPELKQALRALVNQCVDGTRFVFTCRYTFDLLGGRLGNVCDEINLGELSRPEAVMVMNRFPDLAREDFATKLEIFEKIGGHPYTINIFGRHANATSAQDVLADLAGVQREMVEFTLLDKSYQRLGQPARGLLHGIAVFKKAVPSSALEWVMRHGGDGNPAEAIEELTHWGLVVKVEEEEETLFDVHTLVRDFIKNRTEKEEWKKRLVSAGEYYENRLETTRDIWDHLDAREMYFDAGEYNRAGVIVANAFECLHRWGLIELVLRLNEQTAATATGTTKAAALHNLGIILADLGEYDQAREKYRESLRIEKELGNKSGIASTLHELGMIHQNRGEYDQALVKYQQSIRIEEELGDKGGIAYTLGQIGILHQSRGEYDQAAEMYNRCLEISKELGDEGSIAKALHQLGMIHQDQNEYDQAREKYQESLRIKKELGDKSGIASTYRQLGAMHRQRKEYKAALTFFIKATKLFEQLKSPYFKQAKADIARIKDEVGEEAFNRLFEEVQKELEGGGHGEEEKS